MVQPFDGVRALLAELPGADGSALARWRERPACGLGRLDDVAEWLVAWTGRTPPQVLRPVIAIYAGAHGAAAAGGGEATRRRLEAFAAGTAPVNAMAQSLGAGLDAFDLALDRPVPDISRRAAMTERECAGTIAFGMEALTKTPDLLLVDAIGVGSATSAAAIAHALFGGAAGDWSDDEAAVAAAVARAAEERATDPLEVLRQLGGREIAAVAGAILAARVQRTPVILDGYAATAAAAVLQAIEPRALEHCLAGHVSVEPGHRRLLERLGLEPLLDLGMSAGEGTGGAAALTLVRLACADHGG